MSEAITVDPKSCPLCGELNACAMAGCADNPADCWCNSPAVTFPRELLQRVPDLAKGKACICFACAKKT